MKVLIATILFAIFATGCATNTAKSFSDAHESASKRGIAEAQAITKARETEALASASAVKSCESDLCRVAIASFANMRQMMAKDVVSAAPAIAAPVDPLMKIGEKLVDAAVAVTLGKFGLDGKLSDNSRTISAGDPDLAKQINRSNTPVPPWSATQ